MASGVLPAASFRVRSPGSISWVCKRLECREIQEPGRDPSTPVVHCAFAQRTILAHHDNAVRSRSELQFPGFGDEVFAAPAVVFLLCYELEAGMLVDFAGGG